LLLLRIPREAIAVGAFLLALLILLLWLFPKWQVRSIANTELKPEERFDRENEARKTLSQILGGLALLIGFYFTWQNLQFTRESQRETERIATEGQITDRFTKAIAQLGDTKLEIRLGGIYALERIAKDSPKDHWPIMEVLTAYVREHAKPKESLPERPRLISQEQLPKLAPDIQAVLTVIGRRTLIYKHGEDQSLDLHKTDLRGADLNRANLDGADLSNTDLTGALLTKAELRGTNLNSAYLMHAHLEDAHLNGAILEVTRFFQAQLNGADLRDAKFELTIFLGAQLPGANLSGTNLKDVVFYGANLGGAHLREATFSQVDLRDADFSGADLTGAHLHGEDFPRSRLDDANLSGADLTGADLSNAWGLASAQLESAKGDASTKLPSNFPCPKSWR